jgi:hypothetical protein
MRMAMLDADAAAAVAVAVDAPIVRRAAIRQLAHKILRKTRKTRAPLAEK